MLEALEGKRTIKETTSVLAGCGKTMSARETGGTSETGQTRWGSICPRRAFLACLRASRVTLYRRWRTFSASCYLKFQLFVS